MYAREEIIFKIIKDCGTSNVVAFRESLGCTQHDIIFTKE